MAEDFKTYALGGARSGVEGGFKPGQDDPFYSGLSDQLADKGYFTAAADDLMAIRPPPAPSAPPPGQWAPLPTPAGPTPVPPATGPAAFGAGSVLAMCTSSRSRVCGYDPQATPIHIET